MIGKKLYDEYDIKEMRKWTREDRKLSIYIGLMCMSIFSILTISLVYVIEFFKPEFSTSILMVIIVAILFLIEGINCIWKAKCKGYLKVYENGFISPTKGRIATLLMKENFVNFSDISKAYKNPNLSYITIKLHRDTKSIPKKSLWDIDKFLRILKEKGIAIEEKNLESDRW
ncbi:MAG: hypothetical protein AB1779_09690 [Candidatus Thermoplasmatota archaeon]